MNLESNAQDIKSLNKRIERLKEALVEYESAEQDFEAFKINQPVDLQDSEREQFEKADTKVKIRQDERRYFSKLLDLLEAILSNFTSIQDFISDFKKNVQIDFAHSENSELMNSVSANTKSIIETLDKNLVSEKEKLLAFIENLEGYSSKLFESHNLQQAEFIKLKQRFDSSKEYLNQYHNLSKRVFEKMVVSQEISELLEKKARIDHLRKDLIKKLNLLKQAIFNIRLEAVNKLNDEFGGDIIIKLNYGGIVDEYQERLRNGLKGSGMRYSELVPRIANTFSPDEFAEIIQNKDISRLTSVIEIGEERANALIGALYNSEEIFAIEALYCHDLPEFLLKIDGDSIKGENYKRAEDLSLGQRCTTVLPIVFAVSNNPLFIDQPEDNLDNKYISDRIHQIIRKQKASRQLLFITHNPNIPVLSDSELNLFLLYDNKKAKIDTQGSINDVKSRIVGLLEGGEAAFQKRRILYGL